MLTETVFTVLLMFTDIFLSIKGKKTITERTWTVQNTRTLYYLSLNYEFTCVFVTKPERSYNLEAVYFSNKSNNKSDKAENNWLKYNQTGLTDLFYCFKGKSFLDSVLKQLLTSLRYIHRNFAFLTAIFSSFLSTTLLLSSLCSDSHSLCTNWLEWEYFCPN